MSSNLKVNRICLNCNNEFIAQTTTTKYCSKKCNTAHYKAKVRNEKIERSNKETSSIKNQPFKELKEKEFLSVIQVSKLIGCSRQNVYKLINSGKLKATNILEKKTIVKRTDIDELFNQKKELKSEKEEPEDHLYFDIAECYMMLEIQNKYGISEKALSEIIKRNRIPRIKNGWYVFVPKKIIDKILS